MWSHDSENLAHFSTKHCLSGQMWKRGWSGSRSLSGFRKACRLPRPRPHQSPFLRETQPLVPLCSGIPTVPGKVTLQKDAQNLIGISIGGGAQYCPCLYIVQVLGASGQGVRPSGGGRPLSGQPPPYLGITQAGSFLSSAELAPSRSCRGRTS